MSLTHLQLTVHSLGASVEFYTKILGFKSLFRDRCIDLLRDENGFELVLNDSENVSAVPEWFHIGRVCKSVDEVKNLWALVQTLKIPIHKTLTDRSDAIFFYCLDPNGYQVEIYFDKIAPEKVIRPIPENL